MRISYIVQNITLTYFILRKLVKCQLFHEWTGFFPRCMYEGITNGNTFLFSFILKGQLISKYPFDVIKSLTLTKKQALAGEALYIFPMCSHLSSEDGRFRRLLQNPKNSSNTKLLPWTSMTFNISLVGPQLLWLFNTVYGCWISYLFTSIFDLHFT